MHPRQTDVELFDDGVEAYLIINGVHLKTEDREDLNVVFDALNRANDALHDKQQAVVRLGMLFNEASALLARMNGWHAEDACPPDVRRLVVVSAPRPE